MPGNSYGTKGIAAREAFLKVFDHPAEFPQGVARRAQQELGLSAQEPGLMRIYAERKIPMKELKTVQIFTHFLAHQWEDCRRQGDQLGEAWAARGLVMAEQLAIDQGRTQLGFLLSGLPDIDVSHLPARRTDIRRYGRLSAANWMAAQVAFLKDVDYLESRMKQSRPSPKATQTGQGHSRQAGRQVGEVNAEVASPDYVKFDRASAEHGASFAPGFESSRGTACLNSFSSAAGTSASYAPEATNLPRRDVPFGFTPALPELDHDPIHLPNSPKPFRDWVWVSGSARVGLNAFLADSFKPICNTACTAPLGSNSGTLWPCPPPQRWTEQMRHLSPRRRRRCGNLSSSMIYLGLP